uniref:DNA-directed RNA polymerase III subunit RPC9 n=1 Tax=Gouania willdenowi TaxID=441366 RepID=A0A8C5HHI9_GOUWI
MLSNYEVFKLLTDLKEQRKDSGKSKHSIGQQNLNTIMYETLKYLSKAPCSRQSPEIIKEFLTTMMPHKLTKAEKLQLLNQRPQSAVEIQLVSLFHHWLLTGIFPNYKCSYNYYFPSEGQLQLCSQLLKFSYN